MQPHQQQQQGHGQHPSQPPAMVTPEDAADRQLLELLQSMDNFSPIVFAYIDISCHNFRSVDPRCPDGLFDDQGWCRM